LAHLTPFAIDKATYWSKSDLFIPHLYSTLLLWGPRPKYHNVRYGKKLVIVKKIWGNLFTLFDTIYTNMTDRRTDGQTHRYRTTRHGPRYTHSVAWQNVVTGVIYWIWHWQLCRQ